MYYDWYKAQFSFNWVIGLYICWTFIQYQIGNSYKTWKNITQNSTINGEFNKRFCKEYNPTNYIIILFLAVFIPVNFVPIWLYILIFCSINIFDIYYRRYLTLEIKQDLILEKLTTR